MRQVSRLQVRADELLEEGAPDRAADELKEGVLLLSLLLGRAPTDMNLQLQLGFIYKTIAQVFESIGDQTQATDYVNRADEVFRLVKAGIATGETTGLQVANAMHGMCNLRHAKKDFAGAIACYGQVVDLCPAHFYAWHDMFLAHYELARQGHPPDLRAMHNALDKMIETGAGRPGPGPVRR